MSLFWPYNRNFWWKKVPFVLNKMLYIIWFYFFESSFKIEWKIREKWGKFDRFENTQNFENFNSIFLNRLSSMKCDTVRFQKWKKFRNRKNDFLKKKNFINKNERNKEIERKSCLNHFRNNISIIKFITQLFTTLYSSNSKSGFSSFETFLNFTTLLYVIKYSMHSV